MQGDKNYGSEGFEDIYSNTRSGINNHNDFYVDTSKVDKTFGKHSYKKKKRGLGKKISDTNFKIYKWWKCMKKGKKRALTAFFAIALAAIIGFGAFRIFFSYNYNPITEDPSKLGFDNVINKDVINIGLFGIDSRNTDGKMSFSGNSDSIMILSLNIKTKKVKIISLLRDTFVPIEKNGKTTYGKLNSAYASGGPELAIKTVNECFDLDISEYATVNFYGMADIIDAVGGIDAELTKSEVTARGNNNHGINDMIEEACKYEKLNPNDYYVKTPGKQHLNGVQAVAYARIRYCTNIWGTSNDYGRTDRQRYVMEQLFNKAKALGKKDYVKFAKALIPCTETSLSYNQIISIAYSILLSSPTFEQYRVPQTASDNPKYDFLISPYPSGYGSVVYFDLSYASKVIKAIIYDGMTLEEYVDSHPVQKNDWYSKRNGSSSYKPQTTPNTPSKDTTPEKDSPTTETPSDNVGTVEPQNPDKTEKEEPEKQPETGTETDPETDTDSDGTDTDTEKQEPKSTETERPKFSNNPWGQRHEWF